MASKRRKLHEPEPELAIEAPPRVTAAITLRGSVITEAILHGFKDVENRSVRLPAGWIALHTGKGKCDELLDQIMRRLAPGLPSDAQCPKGCVVGAAWVKRSVTLQELREHFGCNEECNGPATGDLRHVPHCKFSPHAGGPICNLLSASLRLPTPVFCNGGLGCWRLPDQVRQEVQKQLDDVPVCHFPGVRPQAWPLSWAPTLSRADVRWHRDMRPEKRTSAPAVRAEASLHRFFKLAGATEPAGAAVDSRADFDGGQDASAPSSGHRGGSVPIIDLELDSDAEEKGHCHALPAPGGCYPGGMALVKDEAEELQPAEVTVAEPATDKLPKKLRPPTQPADLEDLWRRGVLRLSRDTLPTKGAVSGAGKEKAKLEEVLQKYLEDLGQAPAGDTAALLREVRELSVQWRADVALLPRGALTGADWQNLAE
ncbi:unnamed protein product, partial [Effrenium voratum]